MRLVAALLIVLLIPTFAHAADSQFNIYYSGSEDLVLNRLLLDPTTHRVANLDDAATAVYQDNLPPAGPELDALEARVASGMGVVLILGRHTDATALASFTNGAIKQTGIVDVSAGATHGRELERLAAVVNWVGPKTDPLARNISWLSAVRVHERSLLVVNGAEVLVKTNPRDPVAPGTPILLRIHSGKGTIYVLNEWLRNGDQRARIASMLTMLGGIEGAGELRLPALAVLQLAAVCDVTDGGGRAGGRVRRLDRVAGAQSRASQDSRRARVRDVRDVRHRVRDRAPLQPAPSRVARPFLPLDAVGQAAARFARRRRRRAGGGRKQRRDCARRSAMGDCRLPSAAQRVFLQLPALADDHDPVQLRRHVLHRAQLRQSVSRSAGRVGGGDAVHADFFYAARPRHQPGDGEIFRRVSSHRSRAARSPSRSSSSGFTPSPACSKSPSWDWPRLHFCRILRWPTWRGSSSCTR